MFDFSDPFGFKRRKREKMERLIAPYVRHGDDELTRKAIYLALTEKNFDSNGDGILWRKLKLKNSQPVKPLLKELYERGFKFDFHIEFCYNLNCRDSNPEELLRLFDEANNKKNDALLDMLDGDGDGDDDEELEELDDQEP